MRKQHDKRNLSMVMDFYEMTMANGYFTAKDTETIAVFDAFYRKNPDDAGFAIVAGLEQIIEYIEDLHFEEEDIEGFIRKLDERYPETVYVNPLMTHNWRQRVVRFYDPEGNVTKTETIDRRTGKLLSTCMFTYDENGKLRSIEEYDTDGRLSSEDSYTTVEDEHTHISVDYDGAGRETRRFVWVTDADGNALRTETYYGDRELSSVQEVSYDDTGRATGGHNVIYMGDMGNLESDVSYEYDENGVLLSKTETFTSGYNAGNSVRTEYVHDEYGNTLEEHRIEDGKETNVTLRSFGFIKDGMMIRTSGETTPEPEM